MTDEQVAKIHRWLGRVCSKLGNEDVHRTGCPVHRGLTDVDAMMCMRELIREYNFSFRTYPGATGYVTHVTGKFVTITSGEKVDPACAIYDVVLQIEAEEKR